MMIKTISGATFSEKQSQALAHLIFLRFGRNKFDATLAWRRLLDNNCSVSSFMKLVEDYQEE